MQIDEVKAGFEKAQKTKKKYINRETIPKILGYALSLALMLTMSFIATAGFDFHRLATWEWWVPNIVCSVCIVLVLITRLKDSIGTKKKNSKEIEDINIALAKRIHESRFSSEQLEKFIVSENLKEKEHEYVASIRQKIDLLNRSPLTTTKALKAWEDGKRTGRYAKIRSKLEMQIEPEHLKQALPYLKVNYKEWTYPMLMAGVQEVRRNKRWVTENEFVSGNAFKQALSRIVMVVAMSSIVFTLQFKDWSAVADMCVKMFAVINSMTTADQLAESYVNNDLKSFAFDRMNFFARFEEHARKAELESFREKQEKAPKALTQANKEETTVSEATALKATTLKANPQAIMAKMTP